MVLALQRSSIFVYFYFGILDLLAVRVLVPHKRVAVVRRLDVRYVAEAIELEKEGERRAFLLL